MRPPVENPRSRDDGSGPVALRLALAIAFFGAFAMAPATATAAPSVYHVAPGGTGGTCSVAQPCNIVEALSKLAKAGDTVAAAGNQGTYGLPNSPTMANVIVGKEVTLEGEPGQPMPVLYTEANGLGVELGLGAKLVDFAVHDEKQFETAIFAQSGSALERVLAFSNDGAGCNAPFESTVVDSACSGSVGIFDDIGGGPALANLRNDTFYGTSEGGLFAAAGGTYVIEAVNTIFLSPGPDVRADNLGTATVEVAATHSSYSGAAEENGATVTPEGTQGNQTAAPMLGNPSAGDFHELADDRRGAPESRQRRLRPRRKPALAPVFDHVCGPGAGAAGHRRV